MAVSEGQWSTGICGCFEDCSNCCITLWCPCITFGLSAEIIDRETTSCFTESLIFYFLGYIGIPCCYSCTYRSKLRGQFSLPEDPCGDCCVHCWCMSCALCQEYRELKNRGLNPLMGWSANANRGGATVPPNFAPMAR